MPWKRPSHVLSLDMLERHRTFAISERTVSPRRGRVQRSALLIGYKQLATISVMSSACLPQLACCTSLRMLFRISLADC